MTRRRTEITVETERLVVAHSRRTTRVWCARCGFEVETIAKFANNFPQGSAPAGAQAAAGRVGEEPDEDSEGS